MLRAAKDKWEFSAVVLCAPKNFAVLLHSVEGGLLRTLEECYKLNSFGLQGSSLFVLSFYFHFFYHDLKLGNENAFNQRNRNPLNFKSGVSVSLLSNKSVGKVPYGYLEVGEPTIVDETS